MNRTIQLRSGTVLDLSGAPLVMAIINTTPDSFYPPSRAFAEDAVARALEAVEKGAAIIDVGAESTRPGSDYVPAEEELKRLLPVVRGIRRRSNIPLSIDTRKAEVARVMLAEGADIINDVSALMDDPAMVPLCAQEKAAVVLMHKKGIPRTMQEAPYYDDVVQEVHEFLWGAAQRAEAGGIPAERIILDPGIGFGKRLEDNLQLLAHLEKLGSGKYPILVGLSRKSFVGAITGKEVERRLPGTLGATAGALYHGARILRVHDVEETVDFVRCFHSIEAARRSQDD